MYKIENKNSTISLWRSKYYSFLSIKNKINETIDEKSIEKIYRNDILEKLEVINDNSIEFYAIWENK